MYILTWEIMTILKPYKGLRHANLATFYNYRVSFHDKKKKDWKDGWSIEEHKTVCVNTQHSKYFNITETKSRDGLPLTLNAVVVEISVCYRILSAMKY